MEKLIRNISGIILLLLLYACGAKNTQEFTNRSIAYKFDEEIQSQLRKDTMGWKYQISATEYSLKADHEMALMHYDSAMGMREAVYDSRSVKDLLNNSTRVNAKDYIIEHAEHYRIIIINEAHHNSRHRVFTESLLSALYGKGFTCLGIEALGNGEYADTALQDRKYPIVSTGHYIKEPCFGNMLRTAASVGYKLFAYEATTQGANGKVREQEQARNILDFMLQHPSEKILIHCGYDHALEGVHGSWGKAMAGYLKEYSGLEALTIDQVLYSPRSKEEFDHPLVNSVDKDKATVLLDSTGVSHGRKKGKSYTDIAVIHPRLEDLSNRPEFLYTLGRKEMEFDVQDITGLNYPVMVMAYRAEENLEHAVPCDIQEIHDKSEKAYLVLSPGKYNILIVGSDGNSTVKEIEI